MIRNNYSSRKVHKPLSGTHEDILMDIAHELKGPLAPMLTATEALRSDGLGSTERVALLDILARQTRAMAGLVEDLLDLGRSRAGKLELHRAEVSLVQVIHEAVEMTHDSFSVAGVKLELALEPISGRFWGDASRIKRSICNVLHNAAKYTPVGGKAHLSLSAEGREIVVSITDSGIGLSAEEQPYVFERFWQSPNARKRRNGGIGIGLSLVKEIVELHGGTVSVHSEGLDQGSTFLLRFSQRA